MTARERHSLADTAIDSVLPSHAPAVSLRLPDVQSPAWLRTRLAERAAAGEIEVVRFDEPLWPQEARLRIADSIDTDYVVFLDNDVQVAPGWLARSSAAPTRPGAGVVGPLYLWGDGVKPPTIHMAGGVIQRAFGSRGPRTRRAASPRWRRSPHRGPQAWPAAPCDYVEFHCMLVRTSLLRGDPVLDTRLRCVHEAYRCIACRKARGYATVFEPAALVTYLAFAGYSPRRARVLRARWSAAEAEANIATFCRKWNVVDTHARSATFAHFPPCTWRRSSPLGVRRPQRRETRR